MDRTRQRAERARQARTAQTLRTMWQTHGGVTWQDAVVAALATACFLGVAHMWRPLWHPSAAAEPLASRKQNPEA
jgi:hypothetical protein